MTQRLKVTGYVFAEDDVVKDGPDGVQKTVELMNAFDAVPISDLDDLHITLEEE